MDLAVSVGKKMVLLTVAMTVRVDVLQPVFLGMKDPLIVKNYHFKAMTWKALPGRWSFPNKHTEHRASS